MKARSLVGGVVALIGGLLIINSGVTTRSFLISIISYADQRVGGSFSGEVQSVIQLAIFLLSSLISLGGLLVVIGGILVLLKHRFTGKLLIMLGGGMGFLGIAITMGYDIFTTGFSVILTHFQYWIGVLLASIGRYLV